MAIEKIFSDSVFPGSPVARNMKQIYFFLEIFLRDELNRIITLKNTDIKNISSKNNIGYHKMRWCSNYNNVSRICITE